MSTYQVDNIRLTNNILDPNDPSKKLKLSLANITTGTTRTLTVPNNDTTIVGDNVVQTLTNKNITDTTNNVTASGLRTATTTVAVSTSTEPTIGQILTATSSTAATWQDPFTIVMNNNGTVTTPCITAQSQWYGRALSVSGIATFNVTTNGSSNGTAIFPTLSETTHYFQATSQLNSTSNTAVPFVSIKTVTNNKIVTVNVKTVSSSGKMTNAQDGCNVYLYIIGT